MPTNGNGDEYQFEYSAEEVPTVALARAIATVADEKSTTLPPLGKEIPCDALDRLIEGGEDAVITFSYETCRITIRDNGTIVIRDLEEISQEDRAGHSD